MSKRTVFTTISPLPASVSRHVVLAFLHNHLEMIDLNPLVKERHPIEAPLHHKNEDEKDCIWYSLTDQIDYLPGGKVSGDVSYTCAFHDLATGIQTHCRAPLGVDIREKWTLCGSLPGEPPEPVELGLGAPSSGLYIREDCDLRCNILMTSFVKKNLKRSHATLVQRLVEKSRVASNQVGREASSVTTAMPWSPSPYAPSRLTRPSSTPSPPAPPYARPASFGAIPGVFELGRISPPQLDHPFVESHRPVHGPTLPEKIEIRHEQMIPEAKKYRPYSQYNADSQPPSRRQVPFGLRVPTGPPHAERPDCNNNNNNNEQFHYNLPSPPTCVDPALYPTPLRIRGLSVGSNNTISSTSTGGYTSTTTPSSPSTLTHASSRRSIGSTNTTITNSYASKASVPVRIIAPQEQHPEYPQLNPYARFASRTSSWSGSSGGSSPSDYEQPNTPQFPTALVCSSSLRNGGGGDGDARKYGPRVAVVAEHPAILRPGAGAGMASRLSGPFLAEFVAELE